MWLIIHYKYDGVKYLTETNTTLKMKMAFSVFIRTVQYKINEHKPQPPTPPATFSFNFCSILFQRFSTCEVQTSETHKKDKMKIGLKHKANYSKLHPYLLLTMF